MKILNGLLVCAIGMTLSCNPEGFWPWGEQESLVFSCKMAPHSFSAVHTANEWLVVISAVDSSDQSGILLLLRSRDLTGPWSKPDTLSRNLQQFRFPFIRQFRDGKIWIQSGLGRLDPSSRWKSEGFIFLNSYDHGLSFSVPRQVYIPDLSEWSAMGAVIERKDGNLILPVLNRTGYKTVQPGLILSENGGETWSKWIPMFKGKDPMEVAQASVIPLKDGRLLALFGMPDEDLLTGSLSDDGQIWLDPFPTNIYGKEPVLMQGSNGEVMCCYRDMWPAGISLMTSYDFGRSFEREIILESEEWISVVPAEVENGRMILFTATEKGVYTKIKSIRKDNRPAGLSASADENSVRLRWNRVEDASYYKVYRSCMIDSVAAGPESVKIALHPVFKDTDIQPGKTYRYQVSSVLGYGKLLPGSGSESLLSDEFRLPIPVKKLSTK